MIFLLDANFPRQIAGALQALDQEDCQFRYSPDEFGAEAPDEEIFAGIEERGWFLVTLDAKMSRRPAQRQAILDAGLGVFVFKGRALPQQSFRKIASFVLSVADELLEKAASTSTPFIWGISDHRKFERLDRP